jgi:SMC interacting uncharacterized protein involved in chromosome segregation
MEIELLQGEIRLHNETKDAWETIARNAGSESDASCLDLADSEKERLDSKIEAAQDKIRLHNQTKGAWETIERNAGNQSRICQGVTYDRGEDGQWHLQRLNMEIEVLQEEIRLHNESKDAWDMIVRNAGSESQATCLDLAKSGKEQLDREIEAVQEKIGRRIEIRDAWDTIVRSAESELRTYHGATYVMGEDRQWHLQQAPAVEASAQEQETENDHIWADNPAPKAGSRWQLLLDACERALTVPQKGMDLPVHGKEQFQSLGLR